MSMKIKDDVEIAIDELSKLKESVAQPDAINALASAVTELEAYKEQVNSTNFIPTPFTPKS